jgi:hypothetical protein
MHKLSRERSISELVKTCKCFLLGEEEPKKRRRAGEGRERQRKQRENGIAGGSERERLHCMRAFVWRC